MHTHTHTQKMKKKVLKMREGTQRSLAKSDRQGRQANYLMALGS